MAESNPILKASSLREQGFTLATVTGGPFAAGQTMDWQVVDRGGNVVGLLSGEATAKLVNDLVELRQLLITIDAVSHVKARYDSGYLEVPPAMLEHLETLMGVKP